MKLYFLLILIVYNTNAFSQKLDIRFDEECHNENSEILLDVMEDALGEKRVKKIVQKESSTDYINSESEVGEFYSILNFFITFDIDGKIIDAGFVPFDGKLNNKKKSKIINYVLEHQTNFNVCWNNMYELGSFLRRGGDITEMENRFYENLYCEKLWNKQYRMNIAFPGFITQEFYDKYLKDLK